MGLIFLFMNCLIWHSDCFKSVGSPPNLLSINLYVPVFDGEIFTIQKNKFSILICMCLLIILVVILIIWNSSKLMRTYSFNKVLCTLMK